MYLGFDTQDIDIDPRKSKKTFVHLSQVLKAEKGLALPRIREITFQTMGLACAKPQRQKEGEGLEELNKGRGARSGDVQEGLEGCTRPFRGLAVVLRCVSAGECHTQFCISNTFAFPGGKGKIQTICLWGKLESGARGRRQAREGHGLHQDGPREVEKGLVCRMFGRCPREGPSHRRPQAVEVSAMGEGRGWRTQAFRQACSHR